MSIDKAFADFANRTAKVTGSAWAFGSCVALVATWAVTGPIFGFSDAWQLVINTGTTIITFLMVFLIQNTQNRDGAAIQAKLDELILSSKAENNFIGIEKLSDKELEALRERNLQRARAYQDFHERVSDELEVRATRGPNTETPAARRPRRKASHAAR